MLESRERRCGELEKLPDNKLLSNKEKLIIKWSPLLEHKIKKKPEKLKLKDKLEPMPKLKNKPHSDTFRLCF